MARLSINFLAKSVVLCAFANYALLTDAKASDSSMSHSSTRCCSGKNGTLIIFGDSLSDIGSRWRLIEKDTPAALMPPWFEGRYSSGFMWNEWSATLLDMTLANFAYGGATTDNNFAPSIVPSTFDQVDMFAKQRNEERFKTPQDDLVVVEIGTNDIFNGIDNNIFNSTEAIREYAGKIASSINKVLERMIGFGFKKLLVINIPPLYFTPYIIGLNLAREMQIIVSESNNVLAKSIEDFSGKHTEAKIILIDVNSVATYMRTNLLSDLHMKYGSESSCIVKDSKKKVISTCTNPDQYFFMDDVHPTRLVHKLLGYAFVRGIQTDDFATSTKELRDIIKSQSILDVGQPVVLREYFADGSLGNIDQQIADQAKSSWMNVPKRNNGRETPYRKNGCH